MQFTTEQAPIRFEAAIGMWSESLRNTRHFLGTKAGIRRWHQAQVCAADLGYAAIVGLKLNPVAIKILY